MHASSRTFWNLPPRNDLQAITCPIAPITGRGTFGPRFVCQRGMCEPFPCRLSYAHNCTYKSIYCDSGQRRGDILVVLPSGQISIVDVVVTHPCQQAYVSQACTRVGHAAARAEAAKVAQFRSMGVDAGQYDFVPFAVESYGRLGANASSLLKELGEVAAARGNISKTAFVRSAYREVSCALQRGNGMMYARSLFNVARASGRQFMPGLDTPVQEEGLV